MYNSSVYLLGKTICGFSQHYEIKSSFWEPKKQQIFSSIRCSFWPPHYIFLFRLIKLIPDCCFSPSMFLRPSSGDTEGHIITNSYSSTLSPLQWIQHKRRLYCRGFFFAVTCLGTKNPVELVLVHPLGHMLPQTLWEEHFNWHLIS